MDLMTTDVGLVILGVTGGVDSLLVDKKVDDANEEDENDEER